MGRVCTQPPAGINAATKAWLAAVLWRPAPSSSCPSSEAGATESALARATCAMLLPVQRRRELAEHAVMCVFCWQLQEHAGALKKCQNPKWPSDAV